MQMSHRSIKSSCSGPVKSRSGTWTSATAGPHRHWHVDIAYINIASTFYYLCSVLDGYSRSTIYWDIREAMTEQSSSPSATANSRPLASSAVNAENLPVNYKPIIIPSRLAHQQVHSPPLPQLHSR